MATIAQDAELVDVDQAFAQLLDTPPAAVLVVVDCDTCGLTGEPVSPPAAADQLAGTHDDFHHCGQPTATIRPHEKG